MKREIFYASVAEAMQVEAIPGLFRTMLVYTKEQMLCHFRVKAGVRMQMHTHEAAQIGYILSGKMLFEREGQTTLSVSTGSAYAFKSNEPHRLIALEDTEFVECFSPMREDYIVK
jgi:quercetin dioxygenase-like cupin family protein